MFKFVVSFISALETNNNQSATNSPDIIIVRIYSVVTKLYDTEFIFWPIFVQHAYVFGAWLYFIFHASVIMSARIICHVRQRTVFQISTIKCVRYVGAWWDRSVSIAAYHTSHIFSLKLTQILQFENIIKGENNLRNKYYRKKNYDCQSLNRKYHMKFPRTKHGIRHSYINQQIHLIKYIS